jgi:sialic acid synthase SpsE
LNNIFLLKKINILKEKVILSTGMSNYQEITTSLNYLSKKNVFKFNNKKIKVINKQFLKILKKNLFLMHCVTDYPVKDKFANLKCIDNMIKDFQLKVGYSDHTEGIFAPLIAVSKGAKIIEKHFTLNKKSNGPDHKASLEPKEFMEMIKMIRKFELMNGDGIKKLQKSEQDNHKIARKSLVAKNFIKKNEKFTFKNVTAKRPAKGLNPFLFKKILNKKSKKEYQPNEIIKI